MADRSVTPARRRHTALSVCILTRNGAGRLCTVLDMAAVYADEIVVGVDASSDDGTLDVAWALADVVFRFEHSGGPEPARMHLLDVASGDWILSLDDDEAMDGAFPRLVPGLLADHRVTHYRFPRKWLSGPPEPPRYGRTPPWFPDWQTRMFRRDRRLVWHSAVRHARFQVIGPASYEPRTSIVHYERRWTTEEERERKIHAWRRESGGWRFEELYAGIPVEHLVDLEHPPRRIPVRPSRRRPPRQLDHVLPSRREVVGPWGAKLDVRMPERIAAGERYVVEVTAENTGVLRWTPPTDPWPRLFLSYHLLDDFGEIVRWDGERAPVGRTMESGDRGRFLAVFQAPEEPGEYLVEWDVVSEGDCWFAEAGSLVARIPVAVVPRPSELAPVGPATASDPPNAAVVAGLPFPGR